MATRLSAGKETRVVGSGVDAKRAAADTAGRGTSLSTGKGGENFQAPAKGSSWAEVIASARGESGGGGSGRDFCVAISGGLVSVLEVVEPLQHVGWVGRETTTALTTGIYGGGGKKREVARMARVPSVWRPATAEDDDCAADDFMVMCEDGWFGWYHGCHGRFEVSEIGVLFPCIYHLYRATHLSSSIRNMLYRSGSCVLTLEPTTVKINLGLQNDRRSVQDSPSVTTSFGIRVFRTLSLTLQSWR